MRFISTAVRAAFFAVMLLSASLVQAQGTAEPWLGVTLSRLTADDAATTGLTKGGAKVDAVLERSPARKAGLQPGDIIAGIDGVNVPSPRVLMMVAARKQPGMTVTLSVFRRGRITAMPLRLEPAPPPGTLNQAQPAPTLNTLNRAQPARPQPQARTRNSAAASGPARTSAASGADAGNRQSLSRRARE